MKKKLSINLKLGSKKTKLSIGKSTKAANTSSMVLGFNSKLYTDIDKEISKVFIGQKHILAEVLITLFSGGHILINGLPGLAKTLMVKAISQLFSLSHNRAQFTPDLMPSDLIGYEILEEKNKSRVIRFVPGPIFCNLLLADEINRSPAKTQSALLEAMEEKQVTVMGKVHTLETPFLVMATQNPINEKGTYELPEAQLDRFMSMLEIRYPSYAEEVEIAGGNVQSGLADIKPIFKKPTEFLKVLAEIDKIKVAPEVLEWIVRLVRSTRPEDEASPERARNYIQIGCSPRATKNLIAASKTCAYLSGKKYIEKSHIEWVAPMIMRHRIRLKYEAEFDNVSTDTLIEEVVANCKS